MGLTARRGLSAVLRMVALTSHLSSVASRLPDGVTATRASVAGVDGVWLDPMALSSDAVVLYVHGGAFVTPLKGALTAVAAHIAAAARCRVFAVEYRLLPRHRYPAAHDDCFATYRELSSRHRIAAILGDSSGGVLALATLLRAREGGLPQPELCLLLSPAVDYDVSDTAMYGRDAFVDRRFVAIGHRAYTDGADLACADLSPARQDLRGLAPISVIVGGDEFLRPHADRLVEAARAQGVSVALHAWPRMWHGWYVMADQLPEGRQALRAAGGLVRPSSARR